VLFDHAAFVVENRHDLDVLFEIRREKNWGFTVINVGEFRMAPFGNNGIGNELTLHSCWWCRGKAK